MKQILAMAALASSAYFSAASATVTVGNPAVAAGVVDGCGTCTFVINQAFGVSGLTVASYNFYAGRASDITPLLLTRADVGTVATFTVVGIGQQRTASLGVNTFGFGTPQGTNITTANTYFGFAYANSGVVSFNYSASSPTSGTFVAPENFFPTLGSTFSDDFSTQPANSYSALDARTYSINATAVPEPATWAMMIGGFGLIGAMRRRHAVRTTVSFT